MREISSKEYAEKVEDVICGSIADAVQGAYESIAEEFGFKPRTDALVDAVYFGPMATWRDQVIELFEEYGLDVRSDGRDY